MLVFLIEVCESAEDMLPLFFNFLYYDDPRADFRPHFIKLYDEQLPILLVYY